MITPGKYPLTIIAGTDFDFPFRYRYDGVVTDLVGTLRMQVRKRSGEPPVLDLVTAVGDEAVDMGIEGPVVGGWYRAYAPAAVTAAIPEGVYVYAVDWTDSLGRVRRILSDSCRVLPDVIA